MRVPPFIWARLAWKKATQELQAARTQAWRAKEEHREAIMMAAATLEARKLVEEKVKP